MKVPLSNQIDPHSLDEIRVDENLRPKAGIESETLQAVIFGGATDLVPDLAIFTNLIY